MLKTTPILGHLRKTFFTPEKVLPFREQGRYRISLVLGFPLAKPFRNRSLDIYCIVCNITQVMDDLDPLSFQLRAGRRKAGLTQAVAAERLKLSQPYLSQLERGRRRVTPKITRAAARLYRLPPTVLPLPPEVSETSSEFLARKLAGLGYPPYEHLRTGPPANPAAVVLEAVSSNRVDPRVMEAMPWVLVRYPELEWNWLVKNSKLKNVQNRLGFLVAVSRELVKQQPDSAAADASLANAEVELERARLAAETTLGRERMPAAEREWLRANRPSQAAHWNVLTTMTADRLRHAS
jgi:transcriptional regulator with XRE-family HTH domain